ncbi:hypothetical protein Tco_0600183 [Tanacetum coccineum]|uniref:Uncharacterized protein n=1 Tax=Tanacetum coccineum TaxID=301880 RepID=A0ABQ4WB46_9ASTR
MAYSPHHKNHRTNSHYHYTASFVVSANRYSSSHDLAPFHNTFNEPTTPRVSQHPTPELLRHSLTLSGSPFADDQSSRSFIALPSYQSYTPRATTLHTLDLHNTTIAHTYPEARIYISETLPDLTLSRQDVYLMYPTKELPDTRYSIRDTWVDLVEALPEIAPVTLGEVNTRVTELAELHELDTQDLYALLEDAQDSRSRMLQRVNMDSQRVDLLMGDRMALQETIWMVEEDAYASREAWAHSIGLSQATHQELQTHRDHQAELAVLRETDRRRQAHMVETLRVIRDMRREMSDMQAELLALREQQRRARQPGPEARIPDHQDASGDADSHI